MTQCTPCMLCGTHRKLATDTGGIAVRRPRSTRRWCAIPFLGLSVRARLATALFVYVVEK